MPIPRIHDIRSERRRHGAGSRLWAEWCFFRVCVRHVRLRLLLMGTLLVVGALLFHTLEGHSVARSIFYTFNLIFGETPEAFPKSIALRVLFFLLPILGIAIIIEGIVDFALVLRDRRRFEKSWCIMLASSFKNHVVLVGLGRLGFRTFLTLRRLGEPVVVIEQDPKNQFLEEVRRDGSPLLLGDGRQEALLEEVNIGAAKSIVIATSDDLANLEIALDARKLNPDLRVVLRMFDQNMADKVSDGFNIHLAMSQSAVSAPTFAACAVAPNTINSFVAGDQLIATQRWLVRQQGPLCDRTVGDVMREHRIVVIEHRRPPGTARHCPDPDQRLERGDGLIVQGPLKTIRRLRDKAMIPIATPT